MHPNRLLNISFGVWDEFSKENLQNSWCQATCRWWQSFAPRISRRHNLKTCFLAQKYSPQKNEARRYWGGLLKWKRRFPTRDLKLPSGLHHLYKHNMTTNHLLVSSPIPLEKLSWSKWKNQVHYLMWLLQLQTINNFIGHRAPISYICCL